MQKLSLIDTLGPFALTENEGTVNWSKVRFHELEKDGRLPTEVQTKIIQRFEKFLMNIQPLGYNSISIDDLVHLADMPFYGPSTRKLLQDYHQLYKKLFAIAKKQKIGIYVNTDYLFFNDEIETYIAENHLQPSDFFLEILDFTLRTFPDIDGIILRIGENDGKDVQGTFLSKLVLKTPREVNALLRKILPRFEVYKKTLIFRTWTVGVYPVGDLIWNADTFGAVFSSIKSDSLVISMKFGDTDFMRYLHLNPLFFHGSHKKIIELQTRREWEGMGALVSFVGWDYEEYFRALQKNKNIIGIHTWCQTGGWASWNSQTYLHNSSLWNELNTEVTVSLFRGKTATQAIKHFCESRGISDARAFTRLLKLSEITIKNGLYISEFANKQLYFRRTRIPTLLWIEWDKAPLQPMVISLLRSLVTNPQAAIQEADEAAQASREMLAIGKKLPRGSSIIESLEFHHATFTLFARLRRYIFTDISPAEVKNLNEMVKKYQKIYSRHYKIGALKTQKIKKIPRWLLTSVLREGATYRKRDRLLLATSTLQRRLVRYYLRRSGSHLADQSMGIESLFK